MAEILIEIANQDEYDKLREIYFSVRQEHFTWLDKDSIKKEDFDNSTQGELILTAKVNNQIAGFISIWEEDNFIHNLFILKRFRGLGIGKKLIEITAQKEGLPLFLKCVKENKESVGFYLSQGWTIEKEEICDEGDYYLMKYE